MDPPASPPYTEQQELLRLVVGNESPPTDDYVKSSGSPNQAAPRGSPISEGRKGRPHLPQKALLNNGGEKESDDPFADPKYELPSSRRPGYKKRRSTHTINGNNEDAYDGFF